MGEQRQAQTKDRGKKHENWTSTVSDGDRDRQRLRMAKKMKMQRSKEKYTQPPTDNTNCLPLKSYITNKIETRWELNSSCKMDVTQCNMTIWCDVGARTGCRLTDLHSRNTFVLRHRYDHQINTYLLFIYYVNLRRYFSFL